MIAVPPDKNLVHSGILRNFSSFYPDLLRGYEDLVNGIGLGSLSPRDLELLSGLVVGTRMIWLPKETVWLAWDLREMEAFVVATRALCDAEPRNAAAFVSLYPGIAGGLAPCLEALLEFARSPAPGLEPRGRLLSWAFSVDRAADRVSMLSGFASVAARCPGIQERLAAVLDGHFAHRPRADLLSWLGRGFGFFRSGRDEEGSDFLRLESRDSRSLVGLSGAILKEEREILRIFTASRCDRGLAVLSREVSSFQAPRAYTDGKSVFLPPEISVFADNELNRRAYSALTALMTGMITEGSFGFSLDSCAFRFDMGNRYGGMLPNYRENLIREYGSRIKAIRERRGNILELVFKGGKSLVVLETHIERFFYSFPSPYFIRKLFTLFELFRVERGLASRYEGLASDFDRMNDSLSRLVPPGSPKTKDRENPAESGLRGFSVALRSLYLLRLGQDGARVRSGLAIAGEGEMKRLSGMVTGLEALFARANRADATVTVSAECAFEAFNLFFDAFPLAAYVNRMDALVRWDSPLDPAMEPAIVAQASPELLAKEDSGPRFMVTTEEEDAMSVDLTRKADADVKRDGERKVVKVYAYPEYDNDSKTYIRKKCFVEESLLVEGDDRWYDGVMTARKRVYDRIMKKFLALRNEEVELTRRWLDGDEIHLGDAIDFVTDLARGAEGDDRVYQRKVLNVRDIALQILVDASSSTKELVGGTPIIDIEKEALALVGSALDKLGDRFSIAAYNSNGPDQVRFAVAKDFEEPWNPRVRSRLGSIVPWSANRDGCAIRHATARLQERYERTKILLIIGDGIPADPGYGEPEGVATNGYALEDTRRAVLEARRAGIVPFCIAIDESGKDYLGRLYGKYGHSVLADIHALPQRLSRLYARMTK